MGDRVAVYIDFDNVVISRYDALHGKGAWHADGARDHRMDDDRLARAKVDLGAISDFATSFGVVAMTRAYADWSVAANAAYRHGSCSDSAPAASASACHARTVAASGALKAMCTSRLGPTPSKVPIQKSGPSVP